MKILLVEDDTVTAQSLQDLLGREGYTVDWEMSAEQAGRRLFNNRKNPDLIVLDLCIAGIDGTVFLRFLKTSPDYCLIPVLVITALDSASVDEFQKAWPAQKVVRKPFDVEEFLREIKTTIQANSPVVV